MLAKAVIRLFCALSGVSRAATRRIFSRRHLINLQDVLALYEATGERCSYARCSPRRRRQDSRSFVRIPHTRSNLDLYTALLTHYLLVRRVVLAESRRSFRPRLRSLRLVTEQ